MKTKDRPTGETAATALIPFHRLLVAVEAGDTSDGAILRAVELVETFGSCVQFVHAFGAPRLHWEFQPSVVEVARGEDPLSLIRERLVARTKGLLVSSHPRFDPEVLVNVIAGHPASVILDEARKSRTDLIVLGGLHLRKFLRLGSTAHAVLARSPCAVWMQPGAPEHVRRILVAFDFSHESKLAISTAVELARRTEAHVHTVNVFDPTAFLMEDWPGFYFPGALEKARGLTTESFEEEMRSIDWKGIGHTWDIVIGSPATEICAKAEEFDLVVLGTHGRTGLASALLGSVAYSVLVHVKKPTLVVRDLERKFSTD